MTAGVVLGWLVAGLILIALSFLALRLLKPGAPTFNKVLASAADDVGEPADEAG